jgi:hypothetical protein
MKKVYMLLALVTLFLSLPLFAGFSQESITLTTYYPAPFGIYTELRTKRIAIGETYFDSVAYPWDIDNTLIENEIPQDVSLTVEGKVGIGTNAPKHYLEVHGTVLESDGRYRNRFTVQDTRQPGTEGGPSIDLKTFDSSGTRISSNLFVANWDPQVAGSSEPLTGLVMFRGTGASKRAPGQFLMYADGVTQLAKGATHKAGIGTRRPQTKLDVNGGVRIGYDANACTATNTGTVRYHNNEMTYCSNTGWIAFGSPTVATYTGNGNNGRLINIGFRPRIVNIIKLTGDQVEAVKTKDMPGRNTFHDEDRGPNSSNTIAMANRGFRVYGTGNKGMNRAGTIYYYTAWR